jgi:hypothetical protein
MSVVRRRGVHLQATASTWAYFVLHALDFLAKDGRLALLVPEAILQADYAKAIREVLRKRFHRVILVHVRDRIFHDTDEPVVVVAAEGIGPGGIRTESIECAADLPEVLNGADSIAPTHGVMSNGRAAGEKVVDLVADLAAGPAVTTLGAIATVRIGFVTGANHFFIRSAKNVELLGIPGRALERVVARTQWLTGLEFTDDDHSDLTELDRRSLLIRPTKTTRRHRAVHAWVKDGEEEKVDRRHKCSVRDPWFQVDTGPRPDAFVTCSRMRPPLLVINRTGYRCSNALHAVRWRQPHAVPPKAVSVGFLSSLTALWAEMNGRRYGGGVLKLEPGTLQMLPVPVVRVAADAFQEIDSLLRSGSEARARAAADEVVLRQGLGVSVRDVARLQHAQREFAQQRIPTRNGARNG